MDNPKFTDVDGYRTRYFEEGAGDPIVFLSGGEFGTLTASTGWALNFDDLKKDFHVVAVDKVGQGHTDNPKSLDDYVLETAVRHVHAFIGQLGLGRVNLVGHSRGGYAATRIALDHPEIVRSLTIVDSGSIMHKSSPFYAEVWARSASIEDPREKYTFEMRAAAFDPATVTEEWVDDVMTYVTSPKYDEARRNNVLMRDQLEKDFWDRQARLQEQVRAGGLKDLPVLLVWAYNDQGAPLAECGIPAMDMILPNVPRSSMHIVNQSGHYAQREKAAEFNATLRHFLSSPPPRN
ncbi:alpha/beta fold hydrolase [Actinophytocola sp.]|uniref:alpha/beta fold hydrolase n=1 Tax=Actinophytocola sp. TaxID=1872138 RepID=UPI003D6BA89F